MPLFLLQEDAAFSYTARSQARLVMLARCIKPCAGPCTISTAASVVHIQARSAAAAMTPSELLQSLLQESACWSMHAASIICVQARSAAAVMTPHSLSPESQSLSCCGCCCCCRSPQLSAGPSTGLLLSVCCSGPCPGPRPAPPAALVV